MTLAALGLHHIGLPSALSYPVPLDRVEQTHGISAHAARIYSRFFGQTEVLLNAAPHGQMMADALHGLLQQNPAITNDQGLVLYAKTQTHNTLTDQNWLSALLAKAGLSHWEAATVSMTNCASALAAMHLFKSYQGPVILLAGEKAFHAFGARLSVGLLGEAPVAALFAAGGRALQLTAVQHLPRFFRNPDDMDEGDRHAFLSAFETGFSDFLMGLFQSHPAFMEQRPVIVPYNLNLPLLDRVLRRCGLADQIITGHSGRSGHAFCSDPFLNLALLPAPKGLPVLLVSAGMGVTFAALGFGPGPDFSLNNQPKETLE
jgi:3-oxoacyl-[acyl-carrier-protein] synthase III